MLSLYTDVPVEEAIENALIELHSSDEVPETPRSAMKSLLRLAVANVHLKCNKMQKKPICQINLLPIFKTNAFELNVHRQVKTVLQIVKR